MPAIKHYVFFATASMSKASWIIVIALLQLAFTGSGNYKTRNIHGEKFTGFVHYEARNGHGKRKFTGFYDGKIRNRHGKVLGGNYKLAFIDSDL